MMDEQAIKEYWDSQAEKHQSSHQASWGDNWAIELEIETIGNYIEEGALVLDAGCANGYSTIRQLQHKPARITGIDYSPPMLAAAEEKKKELGLGGNIEFVPGNVLDIPFGKESFDMVYTTRVLINLPEWEIQQQAIEECLRVAKMGAKVVFSESFLEPMLLLNSFRKLCNLPPLKEPGFNNYLRTEKFEDFLTQKGLKYTPVNFSSVYYLGSRLLRELVTDAASFPGYSNPVNKAFYELEKQYSGGEFGIQQAYVIET